MVQKIFDLSAVRRFRARALRNAEPKAGFLLEHVAAELAERLNFVDRNFANAAITSGNGAFLAKTFLAGTRHARTDFHNPIGQKADWPQSSEEQLNPQFKDLDLALSLLSLHETNDTPGALAQIRMALKPDGLFMGVMPGAGTLNELRECLTVAESEVSGGAAPRVYPFIDVRTAGSLLQRAGFALPVVDEETITVRYPDMFALMRELRAMGASNALETRSRKPTSKSVFLRAAEIYLERYGAPDGRIPATFTFVWLSGWAPAAGQQKPAKRGSATMSLAEILRDIESNGVKE
jgi:SAM-dependent methyltransferase